MTSVTASAALVKATAAPASFTFRPLEIDKDIPVIHNWVNREYARYWQMQDTTLEEVRAAYVSIMQGKDAKVYMGFHHNEPAFLLECYWVMNDPLGAYYDVHSGDYGFHILVAPPDNRIPNFTWNIFTTIIDFILSDPAVQRLVVEPDVRNEKIHILNKRAGFEYQKIIDLPHKQAYLAFCTREQYTAAKAVDKTAFIYSRNIPGLGEFAFRPLAISGDIALIHDWVNRPYAQYWQMQHTTVEQVRTAYAAIIQAGHSHAYMGFYNGQPAFLWESYWAAKDPIGKYYDVQQGDYGLHLLVAPVERSIHRFTYHILRTIIDYILTDPDVRRLIVEPDIRNEKMHVLTRRVGFEYQQQVQLPQKTAYLAFCSREQYLAHDNNLINTPSFK
ncbi:MAG TPA: GNAT family N-acetyltransferase [Chitinophaga sp.]|uniref:GNAT family N-acetyltransferase n=1 Tax=Chitinophaga sp. TaxID=1869181 RepID=UPI002B7C703F|nr:GNAT family N-acetyltransferase [Chitinophaga sp.]HVI46124.1 GNAT family N-acetyltransferase [Chitinophaga sp.]